MARYSEQRRQRPIYDSDSDSDVEPGTGGRLKAGREHSLRPVSEKEVLSLIGEHGQWVMDQVKHRKQGKWLDVKVWDRWFASTHDSETYPGPSRLESSTGRGASRKKRSKVMNLRTVWGLLTVYKLRMIEERRSAGEYSVSLADGRGSASTITTRRLRGGRDDTTHI